MEDASWVLTAVGPDRPGLVEHIAEAVHGAGGNLEDSRMAILAGDFALIVLFRGSREVVAAVERAGAELDLELRIKPATPTGRPATHALYELEVTGVDQPGIVHRVASALTALGVNVASLESRLSQAAFHGTPMFNLRAELQVRPGGSVDALHERLAAVCQDLDLSYDLAPVPERPTG